MSALPALPIATGEYRALTLYDACPPDWGAILVGGDWFAPHLKAGELAVIDPEDNEPVRGEIYVVKISSPREPTGYRLRFVQLRSEMYDFAVRDETGRWAPGPSEIGWMMHFSLIRHYPRRLTRAEIILELASRRMSLCDGPLQTNGMRSLIIGRVVGVVLPP